MVVERVASFQTGTIALEGTFCADGSQKSKAIVLLLPGSGPVDRDENVSSGLNKFISNNLKTIAFHLSTQQIASFRYDKRGVNKTRALDKTVGFNDIVDDARKAVEYIQNDAEFGSLPVYVLGHSEGGAVGTILCSEHNDIAGFVGLASPLKDFDKIVLNQLRVILEKRTKSKEKTEKFINAFEHAFLLMRNHDRWEDVDAASLKDIFSPVSFGFKLLPKKTIKKAMKKQLRPQWFMESFSYDFENLASKISCPVLLLYGQKDYQVPVEEGRGFAQILKSNGNCDVLLHEVADLNHMLRYNPGDMDPKSSLKSLKDDFDSRVLDLIDDWFAKRI